LKVTTHGGLSVISAFATGIGSAIGVNLPLSVEFLDKERKNSIAIEKTFNMLNSMYGMEYHPYVRVISRIPRSVGLKSSSALTLAVVLGFLHYHEKDVSDAPAIAAKCSRANGTSITGAIDDVYCAMYGGVTLTDNNKDMMLIHHPVKEREVLICYPKNIKRVTTNIDQLSIKNAANSFVSMRKLVEDGFYYEAMVLNGMIMGNIMGYDRAILSYLLGSGATYASISGKGPAMFAMYDNHEDLINAARNFPVKRYEVVITRLSNAKVVVQFN
jgi:shikimate kinase